MSIKINQLEIENVKRVKAVKIEPTVNGLTIVGGYVVGADLSSGPDFTAEKRPDGSIAVTVNPTWKAGEF